METIGLILSFPKVAAHFGFTHIIYGDEPLAPPIEPEEQPEWDRLNSIALAKLKYYVTSGVHSIVWKGQNLTALQYYNAYYLSGRRYVFQTNVRDGVEHLFQGAWRIAVGLVGAI